MSKENDLGRDRIIPLVLKIAIPSMLAQFVNVLYSIVDRMFVGNIPDHGDLALAGVGISGPIVTMITAFAFLIGVGGTPLMGIALGEGRRDKATKVLANSFVMLCVVSLVVTVLSLLLRRPMLMLFGASHITYPYAEAYFITYVSGTIFALLSLGMYQFVVAQGYAKVGMCSIILGAVLNIILDPVFIYACRMGVRGAALATVLSQIASCTFVLTFLFKKSDIRITFKGYNPRLMLAIIKIGMTAFIIIALDNVMIIALNAQLQKYGGADGDTLISVNTIVQSFMLVLTMPLSGISAGTQCILAYNFGACASQRVKQAEKVIVSLCMGYTAIMFVIARVAGTAFATLFTQDGTLAQQAFQAICICTVAAIPMGIQYALVDGFTGMGLVKMALPLSFGRKGTYFLALFTIPLFLQAEYIFWAQPLSDVISVCLSIPIYFALINRILRQREERVRQRQLNGTQDDY